MMGFFRSDPPKWEYELVFLNKEPYEGSDSLKRSLNALGESGWELVCVVDVSFALLYHFKRRRS